MSIAQELVLALLSLGGLIGLGWGLNGLRKRCEMQWLGGGFWHYSIIVREPLDTVIFVILGLGLVLLFSVGGLSLVCWLWNILGRINGV